MPIVFRQVFNFGVVGVVAFAIDYMLFAFLTEVLAVNYLISAVISFAMSAIFNYTLSMRYVFTLKENIKYRTGFVIFVVGALIGLGITEVVLAVGVEIFSGHPLVVKIVATIVTACWNFFTRRYFLDEDKKNTTTV